MKNAPTLADAAIRESYRKNPLVSRGLAAKIAAARRFVLSKEASSFLADLSHASFEGYGAGEAQKVFDNIERIRQLARLPHALTWIEFDSREYRRRTLEAYTARGVSGEKLGPPEESVPNIGWLMEQRSETVFSLTCVAAFIDSQNGVAALPFLIGWSSDDTIPPWPTALADPELNGIIATGIGGYRAPQVVVSRSPYTKDLNDAYAPAIMREFIGEARPAWALLAAINDIPIGVRKVVSAKGFVAKGSYRRFLEHSVIDLLLPKGRDPRKIARAVVALARRRAHQVRGHWRRDWRHEGNRIWIKEHERGDATLGHVLHDYTVSHEEAV